MVASHPSSAMCSPRTAPATATPPSQPWLHPILLQQCVHQGLLLPQPLPQVSHGCIPSFFSNVFTKDCSCHSHSPKSAMVASHPSSAMCSPRTAPATATPPSQPWLHPILLQQCVHQGLLLPRPL